LRGAALYRCGADTTLCMLLLSVHSAWRSDSSVCNVTHTHTHAADCHTRVCVFMPQGGCIARSSRTRTQSIMSGAEQRALPSTRVAVWTRPNSRMLQRAVVECCTRPPPPAAHRHAASSAPAAVAFGAHRHPGAAAHCLHLTPAHPAARLLCRRRAPRCSRCRACRSWRCRETAERGAPAACGTCTCLWSARACGEEGGVAGCDRPGQAQCVHPRVGVGPSWLANTHTHTLARLQ
jgi:hypothetical protein